MKTNNIQLVTNALMNTTINSSIAEIPDIYGYTIQAVISGTPTGTIKLQASADAFKFANPNQNQVPVNWTDIADSTFSVTAAGNVMWNVTGAFYAFVRVVYTDLSGGASTARLTAVCNVKG